MELRGPLDAPALAGALAAIAGRHEVLRSRFETRGGRPVQVADVAPPHLALVDLRSLASAEAVGGDGRHPAAPALTRALTQALARAESRRPFDLARGPMLRSALVRLGEEEHVLLLTFHHAAFDGWSMEVFYRELGAACRDLSDHRPVDLPPVPVQYADFAAWQRRHLSGDRLERLLAYWRERLAGAPPSLDLPADRPRPRILSSRGARQALPVAPALPGAVSELALQQGATPFMVHLAAFAALLHRYTGRSDLVVGTPMANRNRTEVEDLIGFFANSLVLRVDAGGDVRFDELLSRVREAVLGAHAHQEIPFEKLVEELAPERDLSRTPLYQVSFQVEEERPDQLDLPGVAVERLELARAETKLDLSVALTRTPEGLLARAQYSTDLFDGTRIRRLLGHLERLLEGALAHPDLPLSHLPLLAPAERLQVVAEWNDTRPAAGQRAGEAGFLDLFEGQVARSPDAVAVSFGGAQRTYAALQAESGRWARRLRSEGVGPEVLVAVLADRSVEMVVGLLAVLRAGGAYVALDPESPPERLAAMLDDSGARVVLTQKHLALRLPESPWNRAGDELVSSRASATTETFRTMGGGELRLYTLGLRAGTPAGSPAPEGLAYAVFTSGSTGRPKAAMNTHRGLVNRLLWMRDELRPGPDDRFLQKTPLTFDVSVWELWLPLVTGGRLIVARPGGHRDPGYLLETVEREGVSVLHFVPSLLRVFLGQPGVGALTSLRRVFSGGEALPPSLVAAFHRRLSSELHNSYGPAEAAVAVAGWPCPPTGKPVRVPIGRPITGARLLPVDRHLRAVPVGVPGELAIGGVPVGRGYLRRPALTAERFVPDPFGSEPGARLYRSGDLCRTGPGGAIEYLERVDFQVKVRGQRIETGEIEAALRRHPAVEEAVVVGRRDAGPDAALALAAFVSTRSDSGSAADGDALREHLRGLLPEPMVPATVEVLEALPRGRTGKVDRRALARRPPPDRPSPREAPGRARVAPRSPAEREVAEVWAEVLGIGEVGVHDEFFELGGNSISAAVVINRVQEILGAMVHVVALFEAPTIARLAETLTRTQPAAARRWGGGVPAGADGETPEAAAPSGAPPVEALPRPAGEAPALFPASFAQERLWFLHRMVPDSAVYNLPLVVRLTGRLRPALLARTLREVARRQEALRTTLPQEGGSPIQRIAPRARLPLPVVDLAGLPAEDRDREARRVARVEAERPFDLGRGPLVRARLVRLGPAGDGAEEDRLLVTLHHAVFDGWSVGVLLNELAGVYGALAAGEPVRLPEPPVQYADYAAWQRRWLAGDALEEQLGYWRSRLAGAPPVLELPTDHPRPAVQSFRGGRVPCRLEPELSAALAEIGRSTGATPFMVLLAAFMALLARYTGARDLVVGSPVAGRNRAEIEGLLGLFVNTLPLRADLAGDPSFEEMVSAVRQAAVGALAHQDLPFERLVEETAPERSLAHAPLFQVLFGLQNASRRVRSVAGVDLEVLDSDLESAKFDLVVSLGETPEAIRGSFQYNADLFERATVERMVRHFRSLLAGVAEDPGRTLSRLPLLSDAERRELLVAWNDTATDYPRESSLPELFEAVARRRPEAVALHQGDRWWTYGELHRRAARAAARLAAEGVGPEVLVGLAAERSPEQVAGLLGILAAGGAYLPLDATYPPERLTFMLEDARAPVLLASDGVADLLAPAMERLPGLRLLSLERSVGGDPAAGAPDAPPPPRSGSRSLAYTVYTSGSTGRPKGVAVEHRSVARLVRGAEYVAMGEEEVFFQLAPVPFDASTFEIWGALLNGGRLEIPAPGVPSLGELGRDLEASRVTTLFLTTGLFNQMVDAELPRLATVRQIITGGEVASRSHMARMREARTGGQVLVHAYGPTEGTTYTTCSTVDPVPDAGPCRTVPIGGPIANSRVYLLDPAPEGGAEPVPVGVAGELYVGGDGVARGYLARPALTAAAFVPDPFATLSGGPPGARLYRTGDLARWLPDGRVEFLGRIDRQVKLRGFRIELGEVETALAAHPAVRRAVALIREDRPGDRRLVAYAVPPEGAGAEPAELRTHLAERLPEHMVPSAVVRLSELPLDPNGKVDRRALPAPELHEGAPARRGRTMPRGPLEEIVAEVWSDVLAVDAPDVHDHFFDRGGHSLLATRLVARLADVTGVEVPLRRLFEGPTIAELARAVDELQRGEAVPRTPPLVRRERPERPVPASFAQERLWFLSRLDPGSTVYNIPAVFRFRGPLRPAVLARALREVVRRHEALRTTLFEVDGRAYQRVTPPAPNALPWIDLAGLPAEARRSEADRVAHRSAHQSFDLETGPVVSAWHLRLSEREHRLAWCVHHAAADGWSLGIVLEELTALYDALGRGLPSPLPELPVQYADYAVWQRRALGERAVGEQLAYWRRHLEGAPRELTLPADRPRSAVQTYRDNRARLDVPAPVFDRLQELAAGEGATLFMLLLAALDAVLARWSGQRDVLVGSPVAGRSRTEVEGLVGMFLNTLVLRLDLSPGESGEPTFRELLRRARDSALGAYTHQDVPFEMLLEDLEVERDLSRTPLFQVFLNVANFPRNAVPLEDVDVEVMDRGAGLGSKFDLTLYASQGSEGLTCNLVYNADLFDAPRMHELLDQLQGLLAQAADDPDRPYTSYSLRTPALASALPGPTAELAGRWEGPAHAVFAARAAEAPDRLAVAGDGVAWTYGALDRAATRLAGRLAEAGVSRGDRVLVYAHRSPVLTLALLGTLRAGAAFVVLDPAHPGRYLAEAVEAARPRAVLRLLEAGPLPRELEDALARRGPAADLTLPGPGAALASAEDRTGAPDATPEVPVDPDDEAYLGFTSGTTGKPKGIVGRQGSLSHFVPWLRDRMDLRPDESHTLLSGLAHDPLVRDVFSPLQLGATLCVPPADDILHPDRLSGWLERERVAVTNLTPAMGQLVLQGTEEAATRRLDALRRVFFVGDQLPPRLADAFRRLAPQVACVNLYGSTETARALGYFEIPGEAGRRFRGSLPIGGGIEGTELLVLGAAGRLAGVAELGEIAVRSPHLSCGYLEDPRRTAERFRPDPFATGSGAGGRIYCTGDLGRYRPEGQVEISGRADGQVQVRGFRVEPGAVEAALAEHPGVAEAAVVVRSGPEGGYLTAYVVPATGAAPPGVEELRSHLGRRLPAYMVPGAFVPLDALPLTPTAKLDRTALPDPEPGAVTEELGPPETPAEELLAGIWEDLLETDRVGAGDDFFALGGHSLLATRVVSRLRAEIGIELPLRSLFERPRLRDLAEELEERLLEEEEAPAPVT
ncbi:MAG: amino acid adenylation domain-containing protein [Thermoanaerobaculia bacterium]